MKYLPAWFLLLLSWFQPLHIMPWLAWHSEALAAAAVVCLLLVELGPGVRVPGDWSVPRCVGVPLLLAVYGLLQWSLGQMSYLGDAIVIAIYMGLASATIVVGHAWGLRADGPPAEGQRQPPMQQLAWVVLLGALVSVLLALAQLLSMWHDAPWLFQPDWARRPGANLGQPNQLGTLLLMGLVSLLYLCEAGRISRAMSVVYATCLLFGVVMTESRTGLLSLVAITVWWAWGRERMAWTRIRALAPLLLGWVALLILVWFWPRLYAGLYVEANTGAAWVNPAPGGRMVVWPQLWEALWLHPWLGWGLREVPEAHNAVLHAYTVSEPYGYAHNFVLDLALGIGLPLTLILLWVLGRWAWRRVGQVRELQTWYGVGLILPLAMHAMTEFPYTYTYLLLPPCLAIGYLEGRLAPEAVWRLPARLLAALGSGLVLLMVASAVEYVAVEEDFRVARFEALRIGSTPSAYERPRIHLLTQMDAMLQTARIEPGPGMSAEKIEFLRRAAMRFPSTAVQNRYALALALNGQPEEAVRQLKVMRAMHGERHYTRLRAVWIELGQTKYPLIRQLDLP